MSTIKKTTKGKYFSFTVIPAAAAIIALTACGASNSNAVSPAELKKSEKIIVKAKDISEPVHNKNDPKQLNPKKTMPREIITRDDQIIFAKQDLAERLDISIEEIAMLTSETVTWKSSALGCPQPNVRYMQALVPGTLVVLGANGKHYRYHGKVNDLPSYCPIDRATSPSQSASDI